MCSKGQVVAKPTWSPLLGNYISWPQCWLSCPRAVHGWHSASLAVRMTQTPSWHSLAQAAQAVPLACVDGVGASLSRTEARKKGVCVSTLFPSPSAGTGVGQEERTAALQAPQGFSLFHMKLPSWVWLCSGPAQQDTRHSGQVTR